jgi:hypothetical protein
MQPGQLGARRARLDVQSEADTAWHGGNGTGEHGARSADDPQH